MKKNKSHINYFNDNNSFENDKSRDLTSVSYINNEDIVIYERIKEFRNHYLTFEFLEDGIFRFWKSSSSGRSIPLEYSLNNGNWVSFTSQYSNYNILSCKAGDIIRLRGNNSSFNIYNSYYSSFIATAKAIIYGNIMSLVDKDNFAEMTAIPEGLSFYRLFATGYYTSYIDIDKYKPLVLPCTELTDYCYSNLFASSAYLTRMPELPAKVLTEGCYRNMFQYCTNLTEAPELPALSLKDNCYNYMFMNCVNLKMVKAAFIDFNNATNPISNWLNTVSNSGVFYKNNLATWTNTGVSGVPTNWTIKRYIV